MFSLFFVPWYDIFIVVLSAFIHKISLNFIRNFTLIRKIKELNAKPVYKKWKNLQSIFTFHEWKLFRRDSKKSTWKSSTAILPLNHLLFLRPDGFHQQQKKTCYFPNIAAMLSTNQKAIVIVGALAAHTNACKSVSNAKSLRLSLIFFLLEP